LATEAWEVGCKSPLMLKHKSWEVSIIHRVVREKTKDLTTGKWSCFKKKWGTKYDICIKFKSNAAFAKSVEDVGKLG
jgi:hypothetical protein